MDGKALSACYYWHHFLSAENSWIHLRQAVCHSDRVVTAFVEVVGLTYAISSYWTWIVMDLFIRSLRVLPVDQETWVVYKHELSMCCRIWWFFRFPQRYLFSIKRTSNTVHFNGSQRNYMYNHWEMCFKLHVEPLLGVKTVYGESILHLGYLKSWQRGYIII